jgi:hypothetical protein
VRFRLTYQRKGEIDVGIPILERGLALCRSWGIRQWFGNLVSNLSLAYALSGRLSDALQLLELTKEIIHSRWALMHWGAELSQALLLANRIDDATEVANRVLRLTADSERATHGFYVL